MYIGNVQRALGGRFGFLIIFGCGSGKSHRNHNRRRPVNA
jgi:hypothetical protein